MLFTWATSTPYCALLGHKIVSDDSGAVCRNTMVYPNSWCECSDSLLKTMIQMAMSMGLRPANLCVTTSNVKVGTAMYMSDRMAQCNDIPVSALLS